MVAKPEIANTRRGEAGFTLVELVVAVTFFALLSLVIATLVFGSVRTLGQGRRSMQATKDGRVVLNRISRDIREAETIAVSDPASITTRLRLNIDFDADGTIENATAIDAETIVYEFDASKNELLLLTPLVPDADEEVFATDIASLTFDYSSSDLRYDWDSSGATDWTELDAASANGVVGVGNNNDALDVEVDYVDVVSVQIDMEGSTGTQTFEITTELRNKDART